MNIVFYMIIVIAAMVITAGMIISTGFYIGERINNIIRKIKDTVNRKERDN